MSLTGDREVAINEPKARQVCLQQMAWERVAHVWTLWARVQVPPVCPGREAEPSCSVMVDTGMLMVTKDALVAGAVWLQCH